MVKVTDEMGVEAFPEESLSDRLASVIKTETKIPASEPPVFKARPAVAPPSNTPYGELERILKLAFNQAANGKGKERHATGPVGFRPWHQQPILENARQVGPGGPALQVMKKSQESVTMAGNRNFSGAKAEALGAIVYAAALFKLYEEMENASHG